VAKAWDYSSITLIGSLCQTSQDLILLIAFSTSQQMAPRVEFYLYSFGRLHDLHLIENAVIASVLDGRINTQWTITGVYGPQGNLEKLEFLRELKHIKALAKPQWLILGDFNMITRAQDKSNGRTDIKLIFRFAKTLNQMEVRKVELVGKKYT
jgi:exonuclease III